MGDNSNSKFNDFNTLDALEMVNPNNLAYLQPRPPGVTVGGQCHKEAKEKRKLKKAQGMNNPLPPRLLSLQAAATYMGRTVWGMRELYWAGKIPMVRDGKKIYFDLTDLDNYVERNKSTFQS